MAGLTASAGTSAGFDPFQPLANVQTRRLSIDVAPGGWGQVEGRDIELVLDSAGGELLSHVLPPGEDPITIRVLARGGTPKVLLERGNQGEYLVRLTARDQRWAQYAYQFAHELCHILSNFDHKERHGSELAVANQWFEESLCETASLFTLRRLTPRWSNSPPRRDWAGYAPAFHDYAERLLDEDHRRLRPNLSLAAWYADNRSSLRENPYLREKNELVATALLPLFESRPELWRAITHLNADASSAAGTFEEYLAAWEKACPVDEKALPHEIGAMFGLASRRDPPGPRDRD